MRKGVFVAGLMAAMSGCADGEPQSAADVDDSCGPADDIEQGANVAGAAAKTGGTTAWEGVKTFGNSVGGLLDGGSQEAKKRWKKGSEKTRETADDGAQETRDAASERPCR